MPPFLNPSGLLIEFMANGPRRRGGPQNVERMFFELDPDYLRQTWLPELMRAYLDPGGETPHEVEIKTTMSPVQTIFSSRAGPPGEGERSISTRLNRQGRSPDNPFGPGTEGRWTLEARYRPGALEAVVSASRQRNLGVAVALNALILAAGVALVRHTRRSRQLAQAQMDFVATVSHELRTPLTVIRGAAHNLARGVVQEPAKIEQYAGLIGQHAGQLAEMVEQILEFSGARRGTAALSRQNLLLAEVLAEAVAAETPGAEAARCELHMELPGSLPAVSGDPVALRRVFQNLIANAAKHGQAGGWIGVTAAARNGHGPAVIEVDVTDRGPGIPESEQAIIFEPFVRGARAQAEQARGSGLGLSLVREIVEAHRGTVSVRSEPGCGATFTVRLPIA